MTRDLSRFGCSAAAAVWLVCAQARGQALPPDPAAADRGGAKPAAGKPPTRADIRRALRAYAHEPAVEQVIRVALEAAAGDPQKARNLASRARNSGWVPTVKVAARRGLTRDLSESQTIETDRTSLSTDHDLVLEASLTFDLHKLVFERNEVAIAREERELEEDRSELVGTVISLYFERRRLQIERDLGREANLQREVRIAELEALLDAFTDGAFRRMMSGKKAVPDR